jgi:RHS repeat-associated protein
VGDQFASVTHLNWRGMPDLGTFPDGATKKCDASGCTDLNMDFDWAARHMSVHYRRPRNDLKPLPWLGSLILNKQDATGQIYARNRYYDPQTGQFTQQDPIGLAGGLNSYGFAAGDPVNFHDPFGLCPDGVKADSVRDGGERTTVIYCEDGTTETRRGGSRAWRNYNPGNLHESSAALQAGTIDEFAVFANRADGDAAHLRQLGLEASRGLTIERLIYRFAPPSENDTERYIAVVIAAVRVPRTSRLSDLTGAQMNALLRVMQQHEGWIPGTVTVRRTYPVPCHGGGCMAP